MAHSDELTFDPAEQAILDGIAVRLRAQGWGGGFATLLTVNWLLAEWNELSVSLDRYELTIDDYTNDLNGRDAPEFSLTECPEPLRAKLQLLIGSADRQFLARSREDTESTLGHYFQIDETSGWWWKRRPAEGPLSEYLNCHK